MYSKYSDDAATRLLPIMMGVEVGFELAQDVQPFAESDLRLIVF